MKRDNTQHSPDMRIKISLTNKKSVELLFLECSRPSADTPKYIRDWIKLVRMCKDAHDVITESRNELAKSARGKEILQKLSAIPIIMIHIHCHEVRIAVLDRPHCVYYRVRMLEIFQIPLKPPESLDSLKKFVHRWLRLHSYINKIASQLQILQPEIDKLVNPINVYCSTP